MNFSTYILIFFTTITALSQVLLLYALGFIKYYRHHSIIRLFTSFLLSWILLFLIFKIGDYAFINFFPSVLFILSSNISLFTIWSLINWGFTVEMLVSLEKKKRKKIINDFNLINIMLNSEKKNSFKIFCLDRLKILIKTKAIQINNNKVSKKKLSFFYIFIINILDNFYGIKK